MMKRRDFLAGAAASMSLGMQAQDSAVAKAKPVKLGIDLFSLRALKWTPFEYLDYAKKQGAEVVHFSEIRFIGSLEPENLRRVRAHAEALGVEVEIGMKSICPTSKMFDRTQGTAEEQLGRMLVSAELVGSKIVRAVLGSADDRKGGSIDAHIHDMTQVLRNVKSQATDRGLKVAIEIMRATCRRGN